MMVDKVSYFELKEKYSNQSSWAIWNDDDPSDTTVIEKNINVLNTKNVIVGLNRILT